MDKGVVQIYFGEGHGKSTAALGNAIREAGQGKEVIAIRFMKGKIDEEKSLLSRLEPEIKFFRFAKSDAAFDELTEEERQEERINLKNGFNYGKKVITTEACDLVILDEIFGVLEEEAISVEELKELIEAKPEGMTLILTGRNLPDEIKPLADEIYEIKSALTE